MLNRRAFLFVASGAAFGMTTLGRWARGEEPAAGDVPAARLQQAWRTARALGSAVSITALHENQRVAAAAVDDAFAELHLVEQLMSIYRPDSQLSRLNRQQELRGPHPYLVEVLQAAAAVSRRSGGAFDITVQPLWKLFADAQRAGRLPEGDEIDLARRRVDWRKVHIGPDRIALAGEGTAITLNGIAQGFAADRAAAAIKARGVQHALIDTGELAALGRSARRGEWQIGIQHPRREDAYISLAKLSDRCLATSGDYETAFSDDFHWNHLFDPRTGRSPAELASVSVVAKTALDADALSTAAFVLGPEDGARLVESFGADALLVLKDGRTLATKGFPLAS